MGHATFSSEALTEYLKELLFILYNKEKSLFENQIHERSVVFRYGIQLDYELKTLLAKLNESQIDGIFVDSEYNKMTDPENLEFHKKAYGDFNFVLNRVLAVLRENKYITKDHFSKLTNDQNYISKNDSKSFMPDLLIHRRGVPTGRYNHIMLEFKYCSKISSCSNIEHLKNLIEDIVKLSLANGEQFEYDFTAFVRLCPENECMNVISLDFKKLKGNERNKKIADYIKQIQSGCHQNLKSI